MKRGIILACCTLLLTACGEDIAKKATEKLNEAQTAFEQGNYSEAKNQLDSIKILYPKAFDVRREGNKLLQQVEIKEQQKSLVYLDSLMQTKQEELEQIVGKFTLEKDATYQEEGNYFWPTQTVEKNMHRSFLRFQVNERGIMTMTSIYCGKNSIHHIAVKVTAPDGTFAETPASNDSYETTDLGEKIEKADFARGQDGNVMAFLYLNKDKNIKVEYLGDRKYTFNMAATDRTALAKCYELSQLLTSMEQIKKEQAEAKLKIGFIEKLIEKRESEKAAAK